MLKHANIWRAIDLLASRYGLSASGLAKRAGLDPTTFNKSKRTMATGRPRWPSTESIAKVLDATGASIDEFMLFVQEGNSSPARRRVPVIGHAEAGAQGYFDDAGFPTGTGWDEVEFPDVGDPNAYALEVSGDSMNPVYRDGDRIILSPSGNVRRGDRVVVKTTAGEVMAKELARKTASKVELVSLNREHMDRTLELKDVVFIHRIVWASQ
jgi:phage repressor protein C with HTH and peptisase S24 domain